MIAKNGNAEPNVGRDRSPHGEIRVAQDIEGLVLGCQARPSSGAAAPMTGLKSQAKVRPERKVGTAQGKKHDRLDNAATGEGTVQEKGKAKPEKELERRAILTVHQTVLSERSPETLLSLNSKRLEMGETDETCLEGVSGSRCSERRRKARQSAARTSPARSESRAGLR